MCGIAGIISSYADEADAHKLRRMADALKHRGPDGEGIWQNEEATVGFAHRRLAIIDLSDAAAQPLHYLHYTIIFNGEIYNYKELKTALQKQGYNFTTQSDTEVILAAYDCWDTDFLHAMDGMFAFALYDDLKQEVLLARDRFGEKPLYYHTVFREEKLERITFGSEMKALWAIGLPKQLNNSMLLNYLTLGYVQNPANKTETFYTDILSLPPGHVLKIDIAEHKLETEKWYDPQKQILAASNKNYNEDEVTSRFTGLLLNSVSRRLRSDVPVGTSLSGGLDSSSIIAAIDILKTKYGIPDNWMNVCFTAIFPGFEYDEAAQSKKVAKYFGIKQYTVSPSESDWEKHWQQLMYHQEEPLQSSSVFTQYMVYALAKEKGITVLLDGQGADETLAGYKKYMHWYLQQLLRSDIGAFKKEKKLLQEYELLEQWSLKNYAAAYFPIQTAKQLSKRAYQEQTHHSHISHDFFLHNYDTDSLQKPVVKTLEDLLYYNTFNFGLEELLRYADRNSMAHSREVRLPFLNHELVEFIFSLPTSFKIKDGFTKWILRHSMDAYLPKDIAWRTDKIGYEPPQQQWMQQSGMQEMVIESRKLLNSKGILKQSVLNEPIAAKAAHAANNYDWRYLSAAAMFDPIS